MKTPYEFWIGARYAGLGRWGRREGKKQRDRAASFIATMSVISIALGVGALIVVLSVMNGFQRDVRDRMLSVLPHIELYVPGESPEQVLPQWQTYADMAKENPSVRGVAPFVASQAMVARGQAMRGVQVRGIDPALEGNVSDLPKEMVGGKLADLVPGSFTVVLGDKLADALRVNIGDTVLMLAPQGSISPAGFAPRMRQFTVAGVFSSGNYEYDSGLVFINDEDAAKMFRDSGAAGVRLRIADMQRAPEVAAELARALPSSVMPSDWTRNNRTWFDALQTEKLMMFLILSLIVMVAAFSLMSSLVMTVKDKQSDIAILRTLGAGPREIAWIFLVQGSMIGVLGTLAGVLFGTLIAYNIETIVPFIEHLIGVHFVQPQTYFLSELPSDPRISNIAVIGLTSLVLSLLATLYPSWRASRLQPAQVLRHD